MNRSIAHPSPHTDESRRSIYVLFILGVAIGALSLSTLFGTRQREQPETVRLQPEVNLLEDGPLANGLKVPLEQAMQLTPFQLPVPQTNEATGSRAGIWIDPSKQVAFVWNTRLRFYAYPTAMSEEEAIAAWTEKVATYPEAGRVLTTVRGHAAIGTERNGDRPSNLTFIEGGLSIQFVSPSHSLDELRTFAEAITYE